LRKAALIAAALAAIVNGAFLRADEPAPAVTLSVEQRLAVLERKVENGQDAATTARAGAGVTSGKDGFQINSNDGNFALKISGYAQVDYRDFLSDNDRFVDPFSLRRVRVIFDGTVNEYVVFRIQPDFAAGGGANGSSILQDAYAEAKYISWAKVRVGKFTAPMGIERIQSSANLLLVELGLPSNLVPNRDAGVQVGGDFANGALSYQLGVFNGVVDGASAETDTNDGKDYVARVWAQPFKNGHWIGITDLGVGVAGSVGDQKGTGASSQLPSFKTEGLNTFFTYRSNDTFANGKRSRLSPQAYWYTGRFGVLGEYVVSTQEVTRATTTTTTAALRNDAWQVAVSWVVTGEKPTFKGLTPRRPLDPKNGGWGALELAGRYSQLHVDADAFPRYANAAVAARRADAWSAGFNWYLSKNLKLQSNYETTIFNGGAADGDRPSEKAILSRVQVAF
jgi:phosphate-selective porin OprO/OprP